jgi:hypothetical protein
MTRFARPRGFRAAAVSCSLLAAVMLAATGCRQGPSSQLQQCRQQNQELQQRLAEEQQLRRRTELEMRRLADRLAESEKELARNFGGTLAGRPSRPLIPGDPTRAVRPETRRSDSGSTPVGDAGWRASGENR